MSLKEITSESEFNQEIAKGTVVADFNADWCGPCQMLKPVLEFVAGQQDENAADYVKFISVNIDENPDLAEKYDVSGIPCLIKFEDGKETDRSVGLLNQKKLSKFAKR